MALIFNELKKKWMLPDMKKDWASLLLVEKNLLLQILIEQINSLILQVKPLQLVLAETAEISIRMNDFPLDSEVIGELIKASLGNTDEISSLKVVAVQ